LGFSLQQTKTKLDGGYGEQGDDEPLAEQQLILYAQVSKLQNAISAIEASQEIAAAGKTPPWMTLAAFMHSLGKVDLSLWKDAEFTEEQIEVFRQDLQTLDDALAFYNAWRRLSIKAAAFSEAGIDALSPASRKLAEDWMAMVDKLTHGNSEHEGAYLEVDKKRDKWNPAERELMEKAEPYLTEILARFRRNED